MTAKPREFATAKEALLWDILCDPADDGLRLVFADWCEDHGEPERAEFIREQIALADADDETVRRRTASLGRKEWFSADLPGGFDVDLPGGGLSDIDPPTAVVRRGFVDHVTLTTADFLGGVCGHCVGGGEIARYPNGQERIVECRDCGGTGHAGGHAKAIFEAHPITRVTLSDRQPERMYGGYGWWFEGVANGPSSLPGSLRMEGPSSTAWIHGSRDAALAAKSATCVRYARRLVGLPKIGGGA